MPVGTSRTVRDRHVTLTFEGSHEEEAQLFSSHLRGEPCAEVDLALSDLARLDFSDPEPFEVRGSIGTIRWIALVYRRPSTPEEIRDLVRRIDSGEVD